MHTGLNLNVSSLKSVPQIPNNQNQSAAVIAPLNLDRCSSIHNREESITNSIGNKSQPDIVEDSKEDEPQIKSDFKEYVEYSSLSHYVKPKEKRDTRTPNAYGSARKTVIELQSYYNRHSSNAS